MINLPIALKEFVQEQVASGKFKSESDVIVRALEVYREMKIQHAELRAQVQASLAEADRGELLPLNMDEVIAEVERRTASRRSRD